MDKSRAVHPGFRKMVVASRHFLLVRETYQLGNRGDRRTCVDWAVREYTATGEFIGAVERRCGGNAHTVADAEALVRKTVTASEARQGA